MRCAAPTELNCILQYYSYKGLAPTELQASLEAVFVNYCLFQCFTCPEL